MEPIAVYKDTRLEGRYSFSLFPDHLEVAGKTFLSAEFSLRIPLARIDPLFGRLSCRPGFFLQGWIYSVFGVAAIVILIKQFEMDWNSPLIGLLGCIAMTGIAFLTACWRKVHYHRFLVDGMAPIDIARDRKHPQRFTDFTAALEQAARTARTGKVPGEPLTAQPS